MATTTINNGQNVNENDVFNSVGLTPSADDILDVTSPGKSHDNDDGSKCSNDDDNDDEFDFAISSSSEGMAALPNQQSSSFRLSASSSSKSGLMGTPNLPMISATATATIPPPPPPPPAQPQSLTSKRLQHQQQHAQTLPDPPKQHQRGIPNSAYRRSNNYSQSEFDKAVMNAGKAGPAASSKFQHFYNREEHQDNATSNFLQQAEQDVLTEVMSTVDEDDEVESSDNNEPEQQQQQQQAKHSVSSNNVASSSTVTSSRPLEPKQELKPQVQPGERVTGGQPPVQQYPYHQHHFPLPPPPPPSHLNAPRGAKISHPSSTAGHPSQERSHSTLSQAQPSLVLPTRLYHHQQQHQQQLQQEYRNENLSAGVLPDVLMTMRQKIESLTLFDSDMMRLANAALSSNSLSTPKSYGGHHHRQQMLEDDFMLQETRESLKRSSQQSISAAVLVGLAHKRYERRRLAAMEIEKIVRSLVVQAFQEEEEQKRQGMVPTSCSSSLDRVRAILLLLSDDYVRSTSEDARKGGVVALAACAIGLKKAPESLVAHSNIISNPSHHHRSHSNPRQQNNDNAGGRDITSFSYNAVVVLECRDLILASVVHACQDHSQRVRYYATESLFNVVKILPTLAVQHFFILFEILRSLYADADVDVRSGAELLDKKLKEVIVGAINSGSFTAEACVPVFARFVSMRNKATKRLTLTWLQELNEKLIGTPILEFVHLFLAGIFAMIADPNLSIRQSALAFLQSVLPKLLIVHHPQQQQQQHQHQSGSNENHEEPIDDEEDRMTNKVDFDKILQSLVTSMEHPDPFVRKVAVYWMSRIVKAHMGVVPVVAPPPPPPPPAPTVTTITIVNPDGSISTTNTSKQLNPVSQLPPVQSVTPPALSAASLSVRNSLPHILPGILLSMGDTSIEGSSRDAFLPDQTTHALAEQTNTCLQEAVRRDGKTYIQHLDGFVMALREELDSPGGLSASRNAPAVDRKPYRSDVNLDGTGIESPGWFRTTNVGQERDKNNDNSLNFSRLCALHWIIVLYDSVVPDVLKADYAKEFIGPIIHQLVDNPSDIVIFKSFEVLARITVPASSEKGLFRATSATSLSGSLASSVPWAASANNSVADAAQQLAFPMNNTSIGLALDILDSTRRKLMSRDREVFASLIKLHSCNHRLLGNFSRIVAYMCTLQPPEFVFISFAVELDRFILMRQRNNYHSTLTAGPPNIESEHENKNIMLASTDLEFASRFVQQLCHTLLNSEEAKFFRLLLRDCISGKGNSESDNQRTRLFHILLHSFSHNLVATLSLCLWAGAYRTASLFLKNIDPLDVDLIFLLELDKLVELLERPLFRHVHVRMLEKDVFPTSEGSGTMLFRTLKILLMILPQSTCYNVLCDRLVSISRLRQTIALAASDLQHKSTGALPDETNLFVSRVSKVRSLHCEARWRTIRSESLENITKSKPLKEREDGKEEGSDRRSWLGYSSKDEESKGKAKLLEEQRRWTSGVSIEEVTSNYHDFESLPRTDVKELAPNDDQLVVPDTLETTQNGQENNENNDVASHPLKPEDEKLSDENNIDDSQWKEYWIQRGME